MQDRSSDPFPQSPDFAELERQVLEDLSRPKFPEGQGQDTSRSREGEKDHKSKQRSRRKSKKVSQKKARKSRKTQSWAGTPPTRLAREAALITPGLCQDDNSTWTYVYTTDESDQPKKVRRRRFKDLEVNEDDSETELTQVPVLDTRFYITIGIFAVLTIGLLWWAIWASVSAANYLNSFETSFGITSANRHDSEAWYGDVESKILREQWKSGEWVWVKDPKSHSLSYVPALQVAI